MALSPRPIVLGVEASLMQSNDDMFSNEREQQKRALLKPLRDWMASLLLHTTTDGRGEHAQQSSGGDNVINVHR
jgi:hypothetical protein